MNRTDFLKSLWNKVLKPFVIIAILSFAVRFFIYALDAESEERQFINLIAFGFVIGGLLFSIDLLVTYIFKLIVLNTSKSVSRFFDRNSRAVQIAFNAVLIIVLLCFALKFILQQEYGNLAGLIIVTSLSYSRKIFKNNP